MSVAANEDSLNIDPKAFWEIMNEENPPPVQQTKKNRHRQSKKKDSQAPVAAERNVFQAVVLQEARRPPPTAVPIAPRPPPVVHSINGGEREDIKPSFPYSCSTGQNNTSAYLCFGDQMMYSLSDVVQNLQDSHSHEAQVATMQEKFQSSPASASSSKASHTKRPREVQTVEDDGEKDIKLTFPTSCSIQTNASAVSLDNFLFPADKDYLNAAGPLKALESGICHTVQALQSQLFMKREFQALDSKYKNLQTLYNQMVKSEKVASARREVLEAELANAQAELVLSKKQKSLAELELEASRNEVARLKKELNEVAGKAEKDTNTATHEGSQSQANVESWCHSSCRVWKAQGGLSPRMIRLGFPSL